MVAALTIALATGVVAVADVPVPGRMSGEALASSDDPGEVSSPTGVDGVEQAVTPLPPPKGPWPKSGTLVVHLCSKDSAMQNCHGRATTAEQKRKLEKLLKRLPGFSGLRFVDQDEALREFREAFRDNKELISAAGKRDMPESFEVELAVVNAKQADKVAKLPGVAMALAQRTDFWLGKAHAQVRLCASRNLQGACPGRGRTTDLERDAVFEALRQLEGVKKIYLEPREHAAKNWRHVFVGSTLKPKTIALITGESFHLVLSDPASIDPIRAALKWLPGVYGVSQHR